MRSTRATALPPGSDAGSALLPSPAGRRRSFPASDGGGSSSCPSIEKITHVDIVPMHRKRQILPSALLWVAQGTPQLACVRVRSACQRLGRPAAASRDEVYSSADGHVAAQDRRCASACPRGEEADAGEGGKTAADEHRPLASPAEHERDWMAPESPARTPNAVSIAAASARRRSLRCPPRRAC